MKKALLTIETVKPKLLYETAHAVFATAAILPFSGADLETENGDYHVPDTTSLDHVCSFYIFLLSLLFGPAACSLLLFQF